MSTPSHRSGKPPPEERTVWRSYFTAFLPALSGRLLIEGDLELGMRLSSVLAPFFQRFPFRPCV